MLIKKTTIFDIAPNCVRLSLADVTNINSASEGAGRKRLARWLTCVPHTNNFTQDNGVFIVRQT
jgi:hypothetical protein